MGEVQTEYLGQVLNVLSIEIFFLKKGQIVHKSILNLEKLC